MTDLDKLIEEKAFKAQLEISRTIKRREDKLRTSLALAVEALEKNLKDMNEGNDVRKEYADKHWIIYVLRPMIHRTEEALTKLTTKPKDSDEG